MASASPPFNCTAFPYEFGAASPCIGFQADAHGSHTGERIKICRRRPLVLQSDPPDSPMEASAVAMVGRPSHFADDVAASHGCSGNALGMRRLERRHKVTVVDADDRLAADTPGERYDAIRRGIQFIAVGCLQIHAAMPGKPWPVRWVEIRDDGRLTHRPKPYRPTRRLSSCA